MTPNIFPLLSKALWSRINSCYSILFSNLKKKKNILLIELLAITCLTCILRHPIIQILYTQLYDFKYSSLMLIITRFSSNYFYFYLFSKLATTVEGDPKAPIATTPRCREWRYSFLWIAPLYPWSVLYNAEC